MTNGAIEFYWSDSDGFQGRATSVAAAPRGWAQVPVECIRAAGFVRLESAQAAPVNDMRFALQHAANLLHEVDALLRLFPTSDEANKTRRRVNDGIKVAESVLASPVVQAAPRRIKRMAHSSYKTMIAEDLAWLDQQPRTLEREHIRLIVQQSEEQEYGPAQAAPVAYGVRRALEAILPVAREAYAGNGHRRIEALVKLRGLVYAADAALSAALAPEQPPSADATTAPVPMRLPCPSCGKLHIDVGEFATKAHHTHSCQHCGMTWRPAVVATVGVQFLPGFKNEEPPTATASPEQPAPGTAWEQAEARAEKAEASLAQYRTSLREAHEAQHAQAASLAQVQRDARELADRWENEVRSWARDETEFEQSATVEHARALKALLSAEPAGDSAAPPVPTLLGATLVSQSAAARLIGRALSGERDTVDSGPLADALQRVASVAESFRLSDEVRASNARQVEKLTAELRARDAEIKAYGVSVSKLETWLEEQERAFMDKPEMSRTFRDVAFRVMHTLRAKDNIRLVADCNGVRRAGQERSLEGEIAEHQRHHEQEEKLVQLITSALSGSPVTVEEGPLREALERVAALAEEFDHGTEESSEDTLRQQAEREVKRLNAELLALRDNPDLDASPAWWREGDAKALTGVAIRLLRSLQLYDSRGAVEGAFANDGDLVVQALRVYDKAAAYWHGNCDRLTAELRAREAERAKEIARFRQPAEPPNSAPSSEVPACPECRSRERAYRRPLPLGAGWAACQSAWHHQDSNAAGVGSANVSGTNGVAPAVENTGRLPGGGAVEMTNLEALESLSWMAGTPALGSPAVAQLRRALEALEAVEVLERYSHRVYAELKQSGDKPADVVVMPMGHAARIAAAAAVKEQK